MKKRATIIYSGRVQGVGFRWAAQRIAYRTGVTGWVSNLRDGTVEAVAEGETVKVVAFIDELRQEMASHIKDEKVTWGEPGEDLDSFSIKF